MRQQILIMVMLFTLMLSAQSEKGNYKDFTQKFKNFYNLKNYDSIFYMFDSKMRKALPKEKAVTFFDDNVSPAGKIIKMEFSNLKQGGHLYKSTFENAVFNIWINLNEFNLISGLLIKPHKSVDLPKLERNETKMILPFKEQWFVFWGGESVAQNYHMADENQQYAYDMIMVDQGSSYKGDPKKNENYFVFGKDIIAPCDARVVKVISGVHDNVPGELNPKQLTGNTIVLETLKQEYLMFAHLKQRSILVKEGEVIEQGETIAQCGNSGNSTEAHLHLQLQNVPDFFQATGAKLYFDKIMVNGQIKRDYIPVKEDFIKNSN